MKSDPARHDEFRERLREAAESASSGPGLAADLARHVADCPDCAEETARRRKRVAMLRALPRLEPPAGLADRIFAASLAIEPPRHRISRRRAVRRVAFALPLAAAAAVVLAVLLREPKPVPREIVIVEASIEEIERSSPFSSDTIAKALLKARG